MTTPDYYYFSGIKWRREDIADMQKDIEVYIRKLYKYGVSKREIARRTGYSFRFINRVLSEQ